MIKHVKEVREPYKNVGEELFLRENNACKGPTVGVCLAYSKKTRRLRLHKWKSRPSGRQ